MKTLRSFSLAVIVAMTGLLLPSVALSQSQPSSTDTANLAPTSWLVTVEGEAKTRTLMIAAANPQADGSTELVAAYGRTGGNIYPIRAQMAQSGEQRQLVLITPDSTKIVATERPDGTFQGTFTLTDGRVKRVIITKSASGPQVVTFSKDVPAECSGYVGTWVGRWSLGSSGEQYLRIAEVWSIDGKCMARYSYSSSPTTVPGNAIIEIKDGAITFICNRSTGGICVFTHKGESLWAGYKNSIGGGNSGVFKRVE